MKIEDQTFRFGMPIEHSDKDNNWHVVNDSDSMIAHCFGFLHDIESGEQFAKRIKAALNACRGIDTETLSSLDNYEIAELIKTLKDK